MALDLSNVKKASSFKEQFTVRAMVIGTIGSIILTASSMFVALKASSLPWPIMFVTLLSMCLLKIMGNTNVNEINVTHTAMSAGSMVAGGLAFTIPGLFILDNNAQIGVLEIGVCTITGTILGLIFTSLLRKHFVEKAAMPYAMGQAAAEVLVVGDEGGKSMGYLGGSFAISGIWTVLRDKLAVVPALKLVPGLANYGSMTGLWFSPMLIAVGYLIGPLTIGVWFLGWVIGDIGALYLGQTAFGWTDVFAAGIKSSLGLGWMVGVGFAITAKEIIPVEHVHKYSDKWSSDAANHWHECQCGEKSDLSAHQFQWVIDREATTTKTGLKHQECTVCGYQTAAVTIPKKSAPTVSVKDSTVTVSNKSQTTKLDVKADKDAKLTYKSDNKSVKVDKNGKVTIAKNFVGKAAITVTATSGSTKTTKKVTITVNPKGTTFRSVYNGAGKKLKAYWNRNSQVSGYQLQYGTSKSFTGCKTVTLKSNKYTGSVRTGLKKNATYYVRIRTY